MSVIDNRKVEECGDPLATDQQLLQKFIDHRDDLAFAELVARHGGLVLGVCRRVLRDEHSAEDAFQATFLVLARRADRIRAHGSLPGWLYAVAYRTAKRASARRHRRREEELRDDSMFDDDSLAGVASRHEQQLLDEEINGLPAKYRDPLVLHCLMGKSNKQVAAELDLSVGAVEGRLKRGKERLRMRLAKRGVGLSVVVAVFHANHPTASAAVTESLVAQTVHSAAASASGGAGACSHTVTRLVEQELAIMTTSTLLPATLTAALVAVGLTVGLVGHVPTQTARAEGLAVPGDVGDAESSNTFVRFTADDETDASRDETGPFGSESGDAFDAGSDSGFDSGDTGFGVGGGAPARRESIPIDELPEDIAIRMMKYNSFEMKGPSPVEDKIFAALDESMTLDFIETPLVDVMEYMEDLHGIQIVLDTKSLDLIGIDTDTPITRSLKGISFRSALKLLLRDLELTYIVKDEVLQVTTDEAADATMETRVYTLSHFDAFSSDDLAGVVQATIRPDSWRTQEGADKEARKLASVHALPGCLVVTQNQRTHDEIVDLLRQLHRYEGHTRGREKLLEEARQRKHENRQPSGQ